MASERGHEGFFRSDAKRLIVVLARSDDCSAVSDAEFFQTSDDTIDHRCAFSPALFDARDLAGRLDAAYPATDTSLLVVAGIPVDSESTSVAALLSTGVVSPHLDPVSDTNIPSCVAGEDRGFAPHRLTMFADELQMRGAMVQMASSCRESLRETFETFVSAACDR